MRRGADTKGHALEAPERRTLYEIAYRAEGPILDVSPPGRRDSVEVLARAATDAGRHMPVISLGASADGTEPEGLGPCVVPLHGATVAELRGLTLRFGAAVVWDRLDEEETLGEHLKALAGKLLTGAPIVTLGSGGSDRMAQVVAGSLGDLVFGERSGRAHVFRHAGRADDPAEVPRTRYPYGRREDSRRHEAARARRERARRRAATHALEAANLPEAEAAVPQTDGPTVEREKLEILGYRVAEAESAQKGLLELLADTEERLRAVEAAAVSTPDLPGEEENADPKPTDSTVERDEADGTDAHSGVVLSPEATVTVIIAVHNAADEVARCVDSVLEHTQEPHEILLIDDASTDSRIAPLLEAYERRSEQIHTLSNTENRGYTATINLGCDWAKGDIVLLNSDTAVGPGWLQGLQGVARSRRNIATVTPVSNAAGAFSVPEVNVDTPLPEGVTVPDMSALIARLSLRRRPEAPTGNGFCMYIRRAALDRVGSFDGVAFPRGYGEENDFCQRAIAAGLVNVIDDATFVYHQRSASFGPERTKLIASARQCLQKRHPAYSEHVREFLAEDPLRDLRSAVAGALRGGATEVRRLPRSRPTILFVLHSGGGGTPATARDLSSALASTFRCLTLKCDVGSWALSVTEANGEPVERATFEFHDRWRTAGPLGDERAEAFRRLCREERVALLHLRSLIATGPELVTIAKEIGLPVVCSLHDFYTVCPTIQLLDEKEVFCGGRCTPGDGACPTSKRWVSELPDLKHAYVYEWRDQMAQHLSNADVFVTTSDAARQILVDNFEFMGDGRMRIIEHGRDFEAFRSVGVPPGDRPRVVAFGALGVSKGTTLLQALLEIDQREGPAFEFHFLGDRHRAFEPESLGGVVHGSYSREDLPLRLAEIRPSYAIVASIWPETYCHTLTEAWMANLPVFASDIGTLRERISRHGGGWLLDYTDPEAFYAGMREAGGSLAEWSLRRDEIARMAHRTVDEMAADYRSLYRELLHRRAVA